MRYWNPKLTGESGRLIRNYGSKVSQMEYQNHTINQGQTYHSILLLGGLTLHRKPALEQVCSWCNPNSCPECFFQVSD